MNKNQILFSGFDRLGNFPLDPTNYYKTKEELEAYLLTGIVYPGQRFTVYNDPDNNGLYVLISNKKLLKLADAEAVQSEVDTLKAKDRELNSLLSEMNTTISQHQGLITTNIENIISIRGTSSKSISDLESDVQKEIKTLDDKITAESLKTQKAINEHTQSTNDTIAILKGNLEDKISTIESAYKTADDKIAEGIKTIKSDIEGIKTDISLIPKFGYKPVDTLPTTDIETDKIYLLRASTQESNNFEEYLFIDGQWEKLGNRQIDLSGYATKAWTDNKFYNKTEVDKKINTVNNNINNTNSEIRNLENKINGDFETVNSKFEEQYALNATIEESITNLNLNSSNVIESNIKIGEAVAEVNERVSNLVSEDIAIKSSINGLKNADTILEGKIVEIDERVTAALNGFEAGTEAEVSDITKRLNILTNTDNEIKDEIAALKNIDSDINSSIATINSSLQTLGSQDTTLGQRITDIGNELDSLEESVNNIEIPEIEIKAKTETNTENTIYVITDLISSEHSITPEYIGSPTVEYVNGLKDQIDALTEKNTKLEARIKTLEDLIINSISFVNGSILSNEKNKIPTVGAIFDFIKNFKIDGDENVPEEEEEILVGAEVPMEIIAPETEDLPEGEEPETGVVFEEVTEIPSMVTENGETVNYITLDLDLDF